MKPFYACPNRVAALICSAGRWEGTPFYPNAAISGVGVSCQKLAARLYVETHFLPVDFIAPDGPMDWGHAHKDSLIAKFVASIPALQLQTERTAMAGDLIGFRIGGCVQHLGTALSENTFMHVMRGEGAQIRRLDDPSWSERLECVWRPTE